MKSIKIYWQGFLIDYIYKWKLIIAKNYFYHSRIENKIVFANFNGKGYGDNPKYIAEEIINQGLPYDLVWLTRNTSEPMPTRVRKVFFYSIKAAKELSTAKIIINNVKNGLPYIKKKNQYYIQTWHGSFALKYVEKELGEYLSKNYEKKSIKDSKYTDLLLSGCTLDSNVFKESFWYSGEILEKGLPRNDIYFRPSNKIVSKIKNLLNVPNDVKIALYAPTFRDDWSIDAYNLDVDLLRKTLERKTSEKWSVVIKLHPNISWGTMKPNYSENIIDGSKISDSQELFLSSDLLITDYSSVTYDFAIMHKPVFLFATDLDRYAKSRGLRPEYYDLPFALCQSNQELCESIMKTNFNEYVEESDRFFKYTIHSFDDGHASETVVERIIRKMNEEAI